MNVVDIIIILAAIFSLARGYHIGLVRQAGSTIGFVAGLFIGSWADTFLVNFAWSSTVKLLASLVIVLLSGFIFMTIGEIIGIRLKGSLTHNHPLDAFDGTLGSLMSVVTVLFAAWLGASILVLGPNTSFQQSLQSSRILSALNAHLPPATSFLSSLNKLINPNGFPEVFRGLEPSPSSTATVPSLGSFNAVVQATRASVVKVEGTGCGGIVEGSGFMITPNDIATNAHVVAGVANPKVIKDGVMHNSRVIWFDPNVDLAVLQVNGLKGKPLKIDSAEQPTNTPGVVLGYPGGGGFNAQPAAVMNNFSAYGRNIYGRGNTVRDVYSLRAHIIPGNSGGPLIGSHDQVLGIVFATSTTYNDVGYALTGHQVAGELTTAEHSTTTRSTGSCSE